MKELGEIRKELLSKGIPLDKWHHTHSRIHFDDDGVAINKGGWIHNPYHGKITVKDRKSLNALLWKQGCLEILSGYAVIYEQLVYYLLDYYLTNIDYKCNGFEMVFENCCRSLWMERENLDRTTLLDPAKVRVKDGVDKREAGRLAKTGEKRYNEWRIGEYIKKNPGQSNKWYMRHAGEIGVSESTVKRYLRSR